MQSIISSSESQASAVAAVVRDAAVAAHVEVLVAVARVKPRQLKHHFYEFVVCVHQELTKLCVGDPRMLLPADLEDFLQNQNGRTKRRDKKMVFLSMSFVFTRS